MDLLDIVIAKQLSGGGGGSGTDNYNDLSNLPKINDTTLSGNKSSSALGLQSVINSDSKLASDLVDDTNQDNKFVTSTEKQTWNAKQNAIDADHKINADYVDDSTSTNKFVTASDKETWNAKQNAIDNSHKLSSDLVDDANHTNKFVTSSEKQTWNAKQNAIDSDHKLSSSLVSFTTAEAAALASGIDSSKVGQISTNQTNILYAIENTCKNKFQYNGSPWNTSLERLKEINSTESGYSWNGNSCTINGVTFTVNSNGTVSTNGTVETNKSAIFAFADYGTSGTLEFGGEYLSGCPSGGSFGSGYSIYTTKPNGEVTDADSGNGTLINAASAIRYIRILGRSGTNMSNLVFKPMICTEDIFDASPTYEPYALPNYDLTYLEAEDRAALAEVVDAGAKNQLDCNVSTLIPLNTYGSWSGNTYSINSGTTSFVVNSNLTITASKSDTGTARSMTFANYADGSVLNGMVISGGTSNVTIIVQKNGGNYETYATSEGDGALISGIAANTAVRIVASIASAVTCSNVVIKPMLCTKAAFGVSPKFVPYRGVLPSNITIAKSVSCSTTETIVPELSFTIPANYNAEISASLHWNNNSPKSIRILDSSTISDSHTYGYATSETAYGALTAYASLYKNSNDKTINIAVSCSGSSGGSNMVCIIVNLYPA